MDKIAKIKVELERLKNIADFQLNNCRVDRSAWSQQAEVCEKLLSFIHSLPEEPISESIDFERELYKWFGQVKDFTLGMRIAKHFYKAGAQWQKEVFEKNRLAACDAQTEEEAEIEQSFVMGIIENEHRQPTFDDAIKYGMRLQKKKMMEEAIDVEVKVDAGGYPYVDKTIELYDYDKDIPLAKMGDKYKVVLIKED